MSWLWQLLVIVLLCAFTYSDDRILKPPRLEKPTQPSMKYFLDNDKITLECEADGIPEASYLWKHNGVPVEESSAVKLSQGTLTIEPAMKSHEGEYRCYASSVIERENFMPTSVSPPISLVFSYVNAGNMTSENVTGEVNSYLVLRCGLTDHSGPVRFNWYDTSRFQEISLDSGRLYIDLNGDLHFSYLKRSDARSYKCGVSIGEIIKLDGAGHTVQVVGVADRKQPAKLEYSSDPNPVVRPYESVHLECVFSGRFIQTIDWVDVYHLDSTIISDDRYFVSSDNHRLYIRWPGIQRSKKYRCESLTPYGYDSQTFTLNEKVGLLSIEEPKAQTVVEGSDATFKCDALYLPDEMDRPLVKWFLDGRSVEWDVINKNHFDLSYERTSFSVLHALKPRDILCVQCEVSKGNDTLFNNACLNVINPIVVLKSPARNQRIVYGDIVDLSVTGKTDPSQTLRYSLVVASHTYRTTPPFITEIQGTGEAYINTSALTRREYFAIGGEYKHVLSNDYEEKKVDVHVILEDVTYSSCPTFDTVGVTTTEQIIILRSSMNINKCKWLLHVAVGHRVRVSFNVISLNTGMSCTEESLEFYDGDQVSSPRLVSVCFSTMERSFISSGQDVLVVLIGSGSGQRLVKFSYVAISLDTGDFSSSECPAFVAVGVTKTKQYIKLPSPMSIDECSWLLYAPPNHHVVVTIERVAMSTNNCGDEYLQVYDGSHLFSPSIGLLCGPVQRQNFTSSGGDMLLVLKGSSYSDQRTFEVSFMAGRLINPTPESPGSKLSSNGNSNVSVVVSVVVCLLIAAVVVAVIGFCVVKRKRQRCAGGEVAGRTRNDPAVGIQFSGLSNSNGQNPSETTVADTEQMMPIVPSAPPAVPVPTTEIDAPPPSYNQVLERDRDSNSDVPPPSYSPYMPGGPLSDSLPSDTLLQP
ncbi:neuronal cell adhesion molecule isoform X2 [Aplysia californica]|uniref:Neuronal cell adhesion molecule isoform X2 n=1 Tax=Aplysia californica TaxID=6500 RepID=A0ABM0ZVL0_APLCA|nr:neuronal cell adhesion molecule isoform X2 [Aplysia californica]